MKTERILGGIFLLGFLLKILHIPGANTILLLSLGVIALLYLTGSLYLFRDKLTKIQNRALSGVAGFGLSIIPIGILFKLMYWPGAQVNLLAGSLFGLIIFLSIYYLKSGSAENLRNYYRHMMLRTGILTLLAIIFFLTPFRMSLKEKQEYDKRRREYYREKGQSPPEDITDTTENQIRI